MRRLIVAATIVLALTAAARNQEREQPLIQDYVRAAVVGVPVVSSEKVPDAALLVARDIVIHMLAKRPDIREELVRKRMRVGVMAQSESTTDMPEMRNWKKPRRDDPRLTPGERN